jgi:HlyD family secretion protein
MPMKRRLLLLSVILICGAGAFLLYSTNAHESSDDQLILSGNIEAHQSLLSFKNVESRIVELPFDEGQSIEKGAVIAKLDDSNYRDDVAVSEAALQIERAQLAAANGNLDAAQRTVTYDEADLAQKTADLQRLQSLWKSSAVSAESRELAETAAKLSAAQLGRDQALVKVAESNIATAQGNVAHAQASLDLAKLDLHYTVLEAPFSGVILVRQSELGELMQPGTPVVTLGDLDHVWLRAYVSETDLGKIHWGQPADITIDTYPDKKYHGRISFISDSAEFTPKSVETHKERVTLVYRIKIDLDNPNRELKPGMPADATIDLRKTDGEISSNGLQFQRN